MRRGVPGREHSTCEGLAMAEGQAPAKLQVAQFGRVRGGMVEKQDEAGEVGWSPVTELTSTVRRGLMKS